MNISIKDLAAEVEAVAADITEVTFAILVAEEYFSAGGGDLLEPITTESGEIDYKARHNNKQRIFRALRGSTDKYKQRAMQLSPFLIAALPAERRARLTHGESPQYALAMINQEYAALFSALAFGCTDWSTKINRFTETLLALAPIVAEAINTVAPVTSGMI